MISRCTVIKVVIMVIIIGFVVNIVINLPSSNEKIDIFPGILGDMTLKNNETGKRAIANMTSYDDFQGNIVQGYKASYSGINGTMIIYIAQMPDNMSANISFKDMIVRNGYNYSIGANESVLNNTAVAKLPVVNPEVFAIQKNNDTHHFTFTKLDKVYWIGLSELDIEYQVNMLIEVYINVDKKSMFGT